MAKGIALAITVIASVFRAPLLDILYGSAADDVIKNANSYMRIIVLSFPLLAYNNSGYALLRTMGDTLTSLKLSLLMNVLNIVGNAILIIGCGLGVTGAALATFTARMVNSVMMSTNSILV